MRLLFVITFILLCETSSAQVSLAPGHKGFERFGDWRVISNENIATGVVDYWMASQSVTGKGIFSLECKTAEREYFFIIGDPSLGFLPFAKNILVDFKPSGEGPQKIIMQADGKGNLIIGESGGPAFSLLLSEIMILNPPPKAIAFAAAGEQMLFALNGFIETAEALGKRCGFTPNPARWRH